MMEAYKIPMNLRAAYLSMHRQTNAHLARFGVTADQFVCLLILAEEDGIIQQELVKRATSDPNTIRAMLVLLEKRGLVVRAPHPRDGRARIVTITEEGRQIFAELVSALEPVRNRLTAQIPEADAKTLNELLRRVVEAME
ncbi:MAG: MarR family transcriptional regulator [Calditrichaeota bacterium]|nr:MarR family transcriptional regulator [Calditrichota bacterium]MCB0313456.1 MarR family transcriptional regulator [Calditrichota bacterium]MCB9090200.1 MarR family transcriptional regulator [Calditrichia bacterium]